MKRYLIRAGFDPKKTIDPMYYTQNSFVGGNSGNLAFAYGVMNVLKTDDTEFDVTYNVSWTDKEAEEIDEKYDAVIFPMADGFRKDFVYILNGMTDLINRIKIPVIVIGVGLRSSYEPVFDNSFDEDVKRFVKAVLNHSAMLGLRGEITGEYLKRLGFSEDVDYTPIGCPSLYMYGNSIASTPHFRFRALRLTKTYLHPTI